MRMTKAVLTGTVLTIAASLTFSAAALAKTKRHTQEGADVPQASDNTRPSDLGGADRQLQGRFFRSSHHKMHHKVKQTS